MTENVTLLAAFAAGFLSFVSPCVLPLIPGYISFVSGARGPPASAVGKFLLAQLPLLSKIAGAILIVFGLHTMGLFRLAFLETEKRMQAQRKPAGPLGALL